MESTANIPRKWSISRLFSTRPPPQPRTRLLLESVIDRETVRTTRANGFITDRGRDRDYCPISILPEEVVHRVFLTYLDALEQTPTNSYAVRYSHDRLHAPFLLSSVCRSWRCHVLASPLMWTYVVVPALVHVHTSDIGTIPNNIKIELKRFNRLWIKLIRLLLARSGQSGLHIIIPNLHFDHLVPRIEKPMEIHLRALIELAAHRTRIHSIRISSQSVPMSPLWDIIGTCQVGADGTVEIHAPHLQRVELRFVDSLEEPFVEPSVYLNAPRLRVYEIEGVNCLCPQRSHLARLEVSVTSHTLDSVAHMLLYCATSLGELRLRFERFYNDVKHTRPVFKQPLSKTVFPRLTHCGIITTGYTFDSVMTRILTIVSAPNLRSADFAVSIGWPSSLALVSFLNFLDSPTNGAVEKLAVSYIVHRGSLDVGDARTIVGHLPSIKVLTLLPGNRIAVGFIGAMHHLVPHVQIQFEDVSVLLPIGSPQEQLSIAVETLDLTDGTTIERKIAFFDVTWPGRDYNTARKTEKIYPDEHCMVQTIDCAVVVWNDGPVAGHDGGMEHLLGTIYQIIPPQLSTSDNLRRN